MGNLIDWTNEEYYADNWTELVDCMTEFLIIFGAEAFELAVAQAHKGGRSDMMETALKNAMRSNASAIHPKTDIVQQAAREMGLEVVGVQWGIPQEWLNYEEELDRCSEAMEDQLRSDSGEFFII